MVMETESMQWSGDHMLGYEPMDDTHQEFLDLIARLQTASDACLPTLFDLMKAHLQSHFDQENAWMKETQFPPRDCHIDEHQAVLKSVEEVRVLLAQGNTQICRALINALAEWFPGHLAHLDSALAHWMNKQRFGGKPVVFRAMPRKDSARTQF